MIKGWLMKGNGQKGELGHFQDIGCRDDAQPGWIPKI